MLRLRSVLFALVAAAACSAPVEEAATTTIDEVRLGDATDPIEHLRVIAGPQANGRATPSPGLDFAKAYVIAECKRAQLAGGLGDDAFEQPFALPDGARTSNVLALLPGAGPHASETIIVSAHLDHLGPGFPGADDNGSGSAAMVALAHRLPKTLDRTVALLWTTGEEKGLRGSAYFVDHPLPTLPLARLVQDINLDAIGALQDTRFSLLPDGTARSALTVDLFREAAAEMERPFTRVNHDLDAYRTRTDAYSFVRRGVPAIWVSEGLTNPNGGGSLMPRYHKPTDTVENMLAENGGSKLRRMTELLARTIEKLAAADLATE
ncbi:MAG: M28 family peptidase [Labilithrix sp.]|nr:M28 family peptidase [Labilithrix sp.]MCW5815529.1 M28 family peptidase [Labilithrix sp.]